MGGIKKMLVAREGRFFYIKDTDQDFHSQYGVIAKKDFRKKDGSKLKTNKGKELLLFSPMFIDQYHRIKRDAQIITRKDIGMIVAETGINKDSRAVDSGAGSGALACFLANICREVATYDIRDDFIRLVKKNKEFLGLENLSVKKKDIYSGISEKNVDLFTLDVPEPWKALDTASRAIKVGGFLVSYSPTTTQAADFVNAVAAHGSFIHIKTMELMKREWEIEGRKVRPITTQNVHTGFLSFCRKL